MDKPIAGLDPLRLLASLAAAYAVFSLTYLTWFIVQFHDTSISLNPTDWADLAAMLAALLGPPIAFWSLAKVLQSVQIQQGQVAAQQAQFDDARLRENRRLDPRVTKVERATAPVWGDQGVQGGQAFVLTFEGDALWTTSIIPGGANVAAVTGPDGRVEVILWPEAEHATFWAIVGYQRANGTFGRYRIAAIPAEDDSGSFAIGLSAEADPT